MNKKLNEDGTPNPEYNPDLNEDGSAKTKGPTAEELAAEEAKKQGLKSVAEKDQEMIDKLVAERVAAELAENKKQLNAAYKARDEVLAKNIEFEKKEKEAHLAALEAEGKHKEAYEMRLAETNARLAAAELRNTELSRDNAVRSALTSITFRNTAASELAYKEVVANLVRDDQGNWKHRTGLSIVDYVDAFGKSDDMSFLFKPKSNSGGGSNESKKTVNVEAEKSKSLFQRSQADVLADAMAGKLPGQKPNIT